MSARVLAALLLTAGVALAAPPPERPSETRPSEDEMFGAPEAKVDAGVAPPSHAGVATTRGTSLAPPGSAPLRDDAGVALSPDAGPPARPDEDTIFGNAPPTAPAAPRAPEPSPAAADARETEALNGKLSDDAFQAGRAQDDPLRIGGQLYIRGIVQGNDRNIFARSSVSLPTLLDAFLDARPNDHLRAMILGRLIYDPLQTSIAIPGLTSTTPPANPTIVLDRAFLSFDIARAVFVTVGRQHVRWGTAHVWNPTDFLASTRRDPLAQFDARVGVSMAKVHIPIEALGWNFYAVGLFEQTQRPGTLGAGGSGSVLLPQTGNNVYGTSGVGNVLHDIGGAIRGEFVVGHTELGIDGLAQRGRVPRLGADVSTGIGPVDLYAEASLQKGSDYPFYRVNPNPDLSQGLDGLVLSQTQTQWQGAVAAGLSYSIAIAETDQLVLSGEYFFNSGGYTDPRIYPYLLLTGNYQPFYTGKNYASLGASIVGPGNWENVTFSLTNLGNLSDKSFITRVDFTIRVLSYLQVEAYADTHYGTRGGELRLGFDTPAGTVGGQPIPAISLPAPTFDLGVGLRMSI